MLRLVRSHRGYLLTATAVLALAVGANLVVFTVVNALWLRPMPVEDPQSLVTIPQASVHSLDGIALQTFAGGIAGQVITADRYEGLRPRIAFKEIGAEPEVLGVTSGYFHVLGLEVMGRDFQPTDDAEGAEPVAIISHRLWERSFDRSSSIIGQVVSAEPLPIRIVGIAPPEFSGARRGERVDMWIPVALVRRVAPPEQEWPTLPLMIIGRLGPGQSVESSQQRYRELMDPRDREWFLANDPAGLPRVVPLQEVFGTPETRTLIIGEQGAASVVAGLAFLVLLGGCATIAALVLMHYERRRSEFALKGALGASRAKVVAELGRELLLVAVLGGVGALLVAVLGVSILPSLTLPGGVDIGKLQLEVDWRVCVVGFGTTALTLLCATALPIARSTVPGLASELLGGLSSNSLASQRVRQVLLASQVAATVVVLVAAGLFVKTVRHGFGVGPGFDVGRTVFVSVQEGSPQADRSVDIRAVIAERSARIRRLIGAIPGVDQVAEGIAPIGPNLRPASARTVSAGGTEHRLPIARLSGSPDLLSALGVPIVAGRLLVPGDSTQSPQPAVITKSLASKLWPNQGALGQVLSNTQGRGGPFLIVGVSADFAYGTLSEPPSGVLVTAEGGTSAIVSSFVIRTARAEAVAGEVRRVVKGQVVRVTTGREVIARDLGRQRLGAWFFSGFGVVALLLGIGGVFGLVAYLAESQRRESGVRLALGASFYDLVKHGVSAALAPVMVGIACGLMMAGLTSLLPGVSSLDLETYSGVAAATLVGATIAALAASRRLKTSTLCDCLRAR